MGNFRFSAELNELVGPEGRCHLEPRATAVLVELVEHAGQVRSREELLDAVWHDAFVGEAALTHCIWELRKAFGDSARKPTVIQTVPKKGYRLIVPAVPTSLGASSIEPTLKALLRMVDLDHPGREGEHAETETSTPEVGRAAARSEAVEAGAIGVAAIEVGAIELAAIDVGAIDVGAIEVKVDSGLLWLFARPIDAVRHALAVAREAGRSPRAVIHMQEVRVGASAGDAGPAAVEEPVGQWMDRLAHAARPGQVLLTRVAFELARRAVEADDSDDAEEGLQWLAHGPFAVDGAEEPVDLFEVGVGGRSPLAAPEPSAVARRVGAEGVILGWRPGPGVAVPGRPHWRLAEKLGEGGFGEVWLTEHRKTGERRVFKFCFEAERLRALQREVTLFRLLKETLGERDDIVHLLDWNFEQAPYFIEMEHTSAGSLADWAEQQGGLEEIPLEQRLTLLAQVAEALAAAHSVGVLHKDVKPSNILIHLDHESRPRARLGDFGIGRILDPRQLEDAGITVFGLLDETEDSSSDGTRLYMAPEILEGRVASTEADVYALGVVLYQAAVGELDRAVATGWQRQVADEVLAEDIAQCVDQLPSRRPSARDVADRLRRLDERRRLLREEREERRQAATDRAALVLARRRRRLWLGAAVLALLVSAVVSILALQATRARAEAERHRSSAEDLVSFMLGDLRQTLQSVGRLDAMDDTLEEVGRYLEAIEPEELAAADLDRQIRALHQVGEVRLEQGELERAEEAFRESLRLAGVLVEKEAANGDWRASEADSRFWLAYVADRRGDFTAALDGYHYHRAAYEQLVAEDPDRRGWQLEWAYGYQNVANLLSRSGRLEEALVQFREHARILRAVSEEDPENLDLRFDLAVSHNRIGVVEHKRGQLRSALEEFRADQEILADLVKRQPNDTRYRNRLATSSAYLGSLLDMLGRPDAALREFRQVLTLRRELAELDASNARWRKSLARAERRVGRALVAEGAVAQGADLLEAARHHWLELGAADSEISADRRELAVVLRCLAEARAMLGDRPRASAQLGRSLAILERLATERPEDWQTATRLSRSYLLLAKLDENPAGSDTGAAEYRRRAVAAVEGFARDSENPEILAVYAEALLAAGERQRAEPVAAWLRARGYAQSSFVEADRRPGVDQPPGPG